MKYGSALKILVICMILGVIGEGCVLLLGIKFHIDLRAEQEKANRALSEWNNYNGRTAQLLFSSRSYPELLSEWMDAVDDFDAALDALTHSRTVRILDPSFAVSLDNLTSLWTLSFQRTKIIDSSLRELSSSLEKVLPPVGGLLFNLGKLSTGVTEAEINQIFILRTNVRELLSMNEEFYLILSGMVEQSSLKVDRSITDSLVFMALLSIIIILSALQMGISVSREITLTNSRLENQIREKNQTQEQLEMARDAAEAADRSKTQFLANVSHELRTPLNSIIGYSELNLVPDEKGQRRDFSPLIIKESEKLLHLVNDILDFSKLEFHKLKLEHIAFALSSMLAESTGTLKFRAERKGLEFSLTIGEGVPDYVIGDPYRLRQVVVNLLDNAIKFTEKGSVSLHVEPARVETDYCILQFEVEDTGIGIPTEIQQQIFESFTQADGSMSRRYGGTGLGTTIARHLVWLMEGEMTLSSFPGRGSSFAFTARFGLEAVQPPPGTAEGFPGNAVGASPVRWTRSASILLVDDYQPNADVAVRFLTQAGYTVSYASDGRRALEMVRANRYDLILMDVQMPGLDGYETARTMREEISWVHSIHILALTANAFESDREKALAAGMSALLSKPVRRESLLQAVAFWLSSSGTGEPETPRPPERAVEAAPSVSGPASGHVLEGPVLLEQFMAEIGDVETAGELLRGFMDAMTAQIPVLYKALADNDLTTLHREVHSIKGGALNIMAPRLAEVSAQLERAAREADRELILKMIEPLMSEIQTVHRFLDTAGITAHPAGTVGHSPV